MALMVLISCNNSSNKEAETVQTEFQTEEENVREKPLTLQDLKKDFKFFNLTMFEMDTFNWETRRGKYKELDSITFYMVWQNGKRKFQYYAPDYLFSWQDRDTNFIEFTIFAPDQEDGGWCNYIIYCIFDKNGKFIDKFDVSLSCGDGGQIIEASGKFINKKTYELLCVEYNLLFPSDNEELYNEKGVLYDEGEELYEGDSTLYHYIINDKGKVTQKEIFKKHFIEKY